MSFQLIAHRKQLVSTLIVLLINVMMGLSNMFDFLTKRGTCIKLMEVDTKYESITFAILFIRLHR